MKELNEGCSQALRDETSKSPHTEVCAPKIMLYAHKVFAILLQNQVSKHPWTFPKGCEALWWNPPISHTKGGSQVCKRCQNPDTAWDRARQIAVYKFSASNIQTWVVSVWNFVFTTSSIHCVLHLNFESNPFSSNWILVHTVIPLRQGYPLGNEGWEWRISPCSRKWKWKWNNACSCSISAFRTAQETQNHKTYTHANVNYCI